MAVENKDQLNVRQDKISGQNPKSFYIAAVAAVAVIAIALIVLFMFNTKSHQTPNNIGQIKAGVPVPISNFSMLLGSGFNASSYTVSYSGALYLNVSGVTASAPLNITVYKNGSDARILLDVNPLPIFGGNMSQQYIKNGTSYYTCSKIVGGKLSNQSTSTYSCMETNQSGSIFGLFDYGSSNLTVNESSLGASSYDGSPCLSVYGLIESASYGHIIGSGIKSRAEVLACTSNKLDIPLNISIGLTTSNSTAIGNVYINLHETSHSYSSPSNITDLSGPLIASAQYKINNSALNVTGSCGTSPFPQPENLICLNASLDTNGLLTMNIESTSNSPFYVHDMVCNSDSNYSISNLGGYVNGIELNSTPGNTVEVNKTFNAAIRCKNTNGTFGFPAGKQFYGGVLVAYSNTSLANTYSVSTFDMNVIAVNSIS